MLDSGRFISDVIVAYGNSRGNPEKVLPKISGMLIAKEVRGKPILLKSSILHFDTAEFQKTEVHIVF